MSSLQNNNNHKKKKNLSCDAVKIGEFLCLSSKFKTSHVQRTHVSKLGLNYAQKTGLA